MNRRRLPRTVRPSVFLFLQQVGLPYLTQSGGRGLSQMMPSRSGAWCLILLLLVSALLRVKTSFLLRLSLNLT